ncbi:MAG: hypothetical protein IPL52_13925 [Flavobacteriales bacterium]|nr:hypothetical protein [Flavobacteriales bacterium]
MGRSRLAALPETLVELPRADSAGLNIATIVIVGFSSLGVLRAVFNKQRIQCACQGTVFDLPMSTVTIIEDPPMLAMAAGMLVAL